MPPLNEQDSELKRLITEEVAKRKKQRWTFGAEFTILSIGLRVLEEIEQREAFELGDVMSERRIEEMKGDLWEILRRKK